MHFPAHASNVNVDNGGDEDTQYQVTSGNSGSRQHRQPFAHVHAASRFNDNDGNDRSDNDNNNYSYNNNNNYTASDEYDDDDDNNHDDHDGSSQRTVSPPSDAPSDASRLSADLQLLRQKINKSKHNNSNNNNNNDNSDNGKSDVGQALGRELVEERRRRIQAEETAAKVSEMLCCVGGLVGCLSVCSFVCLFVCSFVCLIVCC